MGSAARSEAVRAGERAPEFTLRAANRFANGVPVEFSLGQLLAGGAAVLEFLRGTW
jgi:hypothetical protein